MYFLQRDDGYYVARPGSLKSYTHRFESARPFKTREAAEADRCVENENIVSLSDIVSNFY